MLGAIFNVLPDWAMSIVVGGLLWFGVNYVWLSPAYFERAGARACGASLISENTSPIRFDMALYTATLGFIGSETALIRQACGRSR